MKRAADALALTHVSCLVGLICCPVGVYVFRHNDAPLILVTVGMSLALISWWYFGGCPLTVWENRLRRVCDPAGCYSGACVNHYAKKLLGVNLPQWTIHTLVIGSLLASILIRFLR